MILSSITLTYQLLFQTSAGRPGAGMPKRRREEDGDENCGQALLKTHVSQKEVNLGVLQERNMQAVYNKVKELYLNQILKAL